MHESKEHQSLLHIARLTAFHFSQVAIRKNVFPSHISWRSSHSHNCWKGEFCLHCCWNPWMKSIPDFFHYFMMARFSLQARLGGRGSKESPTTHSSKIRTLIPATHASNIWTLTHISLWYVCHIVICVSDIIVHIHTHTTFTHTHAHEHAHTCTHACMRARTSDSHSYSNSRSHLSESLWDSGMCTPWLASVTLGVNCSWVNLKVFESLFLGYFSRLY